MKILIAPDSFKGTLSATEVCALLAQTLRAQVPDAEITQIPIADGGEGTVDAYLHSFGGNRITVRAHSPLGREMDAVYGILSDGTAVIETAAASGIAIEPKNDALHASTFGTGELLKDALDRGCRSVILGLGGSATTDGGVGFAQALGASFRDANGNELAHGGASLDQLQTVDLRGLDARLRKTDIRVLCDVENPLFGERGAAFVYAPQKGASAQDVQRLDQGLRRLASVCRATLSKDYAAEPGAGAAGGMGFACRAFLDAALVGGIDCILDAAQFQKQAEHADLIITGEGKMDAQSLMGKAPFGVAKRSAGTKVIAVVGLLDAPLDAVHRAGISEVYETNDRHLPFDAIKDHAAEDLIRAARRICL